MNDIKTPNKNGRPFDQAKFASYKRDHCCGISQDQAEKLHTSFDAEMWQAAGRAAASERAKYAIPAPKEADLELDR
jgi:hypothetical protein